MLDECAVLRTGVLDMLRNDPFPGIPQSLAVPHVMVSVRPTIHDLQFLIDILFLHQLGREVDGLDFDVQLAQLCRQFVYLLAQGFDINGCHILDLAARVAFAG